MSKVFKFDVNEAATIYDDKYGMGKRTGEVIKAFCQENHESDKLVCRYYPEGADECGDCPYCTLLNDMEFAVRDDTLDMVAENFIDCLVIEDE